MKHNTFSRLCSVSIIALLLHSCDSLPKSGPSNGDVERSAAMRVRTPDRKVGIDYVLLDINKAILGYFEAPQTSSLAQTFGVRGTSPADTPLGYGDVVQVSIFESQSGGLFIPNDAGSRPGNYITLPNQTIDRSGNISVPYAGTIKAAGRSKSAVEADIQNKLSNRAIEPQVIVSLVNSRSNDVAMLGDVQNPAKIELNASGERILDAISEAGGLSGASLESDITVQRAGRSVTVPYTALLANPVENIYLRPHDTVIVHHYQRTFTAFGATGENGRFAFEDSDLTLADAIGKAGGLLDTRADPAQVLLYRYVAKDTLRMLGVDTSHFLAASVPVIFKGNLRDPSGYFATQKFAMHDKDVLYISTSASVELLKFLDIANSVTATASGTTNDAVRTRDAVRDLTP